MKYILQSFVIFSLLMSGIAHATQFKVFVFTKTDGWHHKSINQGVTAFKQMAEQHNFALEWHEDATRINDDNLKQFDVIVFLLTTGNVLNEQQQAAMERFIQAGKGFVGIHSASDTEHDWPWYKKLVGRSFKIHPQIQTAKLSVLQPEFPGLEFMPKEFFWTDEWYEFGQEHSKTLSYLLTIDEKSYAPEADWDKVTGKGMGKFHPLAWYQEYDGGRSFYTALGHVGSSYFHPLLQSHIYGGIFWAATGKGFK